VWPFKKKYLPPEELEFSDQWSLSEGTHAGNSLIVRVNRGVDQAIGHPDFSHRAGVAIPLRDPDENGFPIGDEAAQLQTVEDLLVERLAAERLGIFVLTISTGGMREFVFYTRDPEVTHHALEDVNRLVGSHEVQHIIEPDPKWSVYKQFAQS
jgi:hypothetical protein